MNIQSLPDQAEIESALGLDPGSRHKRTVRRFAWLMIVIAVGVGGAWWLTSAPERDTVSGFQSEDVVRSTIVVTVQSTGKIQPTTEVDVSSEMSGVIRTVNVDNNSVIRRGDVLAELDSLKLRAQLDRAKASLAASEARVLTAKVTVAETNRARERLTALQKKGLSSTQDLESAAAAHDRADAGLSAAEADVAVAMADVKLQQTDVDKTRILSPIDGIVLKRTAEPGQTVASSLQAPILFTLAEDLARMQVEADIDEADIGAVSVGQNASFTVDAYPGREFPAVIKTIEFSPRITDSVVTYTAILAVDNSDLLLRPGMTTTAQIVVREIPNALTVPNAALRYEPPKTKPSQGFSITSLFMPRIPRSEKSASRETTSGERTVYVLEGGVPRAVTVKTGASDGAVTEIAGGELKEGDKIITGSKPGAP